MYFISIFIWNFLTNLFYNISNHEIFLSFWLVLVLIVFVQFWLESALSHLIFLLSLLLCLYLLLLVLDPMLCTIMNVKALSWIIFYFYFLFLCYILILSINQKRTLPTIIAHHRGCFVFNFAWRIIVLILFYLLIQQTDLRQNLIFVYSRRLNLLSLLLHIIRRYIFIFNWCNFVNHDGIFHNAVVFTRMRIIQWFINYKWTAQRMKQGIV